MSGSTSTSTGRSPERATTFAVAVVDLNHIRLPAVHVALVGAGQEDGEVSEALGVAVGDPRARGEQLVEPRELRDADRAQDVREAVVQPRHGHVGRRERLPAVVRDLADRRGDLGI